jgi:hypothetical protein
LFDAFLASYCLAIQLHTSLFFIPHTSPFTPYPSHLESFFSLLDLALT